MFGDTQADGTSLSVRATALGLGGIDASAFTGIDRLAMFGGGAFAFELQLFLGAEAQVRLALIDQAVRVLAIDFEAVGLAIGAEWAAEVRAFVPIQAQPSQIGDKLIFEAGFAAVDVSVFDAEHHGSTLVAHKKPIEERSAGIADMKVAGRGWSEADTDVLGHEEMVAGCSMRGRVARSSTTDGDSRSSDHFLPSAVL